jgi:hypothetical protein
MQDKFEGKGNELIDIYYHAVYIKRVKMSQQFVKKIMCSHCLLSSCNKIGEINRVNTNSYINKSDIAYPIFFP